MTGIALEGIAGVDGSLLRRSVDAIAETAEQLDAEPRFPLAEMRLLARAGMLDFTTPGADGSRPSLIDEWRLLREVAAASGSVGRILDGHLNAVERISVAAPPEARARELGAVRGGDRILGVWGADPGPGEGEPATVSGEDDALRLDGAKTFCSGAGGVDAALVMVRAQESPPLVVMVEIDETVTVDRSWFRPGGLRASESHRVVFSGTPVSFVLGGPGEMGREPWFSRDAMRTATTWAGMADAAAADAIADLAARRRGDELARLAAGRISAAVGTIDAWLAAAATEAERGGELRSLSIRMRAEIVRAADVIVDEAARACGSRPFAVGSALDRARRDLAIFTLQHRLDPLLARLGGSLLDPKTAAS